jgi:molecular chaperone DnaK (HSP70)
LVTAGGGWVVAVDFGTTATAAAVGADGAVASLVLADGASTMASSVFAESYGLLVVGADADNQAEMRLDAYEPTPKRRVGHPRVRLGDADYAPAELIGAVLAAVLGEAMLQHDRTPPSSVVLTHPVSWKTSRQKVLTDALTAAANTLGVNGLPLPVFVPEPVAAARWYAHDRAPAPGEYFAVYDLGGGTFDTTVLRATGGGGYEVLANGGIDPLGGYDFDNLLVTYLGERYIAAEVGD